MSYIEKIFNHVVQFKDEESYLEAKLQKIREFPNISFLEFLQDEMYDKEKCEVENMHQEQSWSMGVDTSSNNPDQGFTAYYGETGEEEMENAYVYLTSQFEQVDRSKKKISDDSAKTLDDPSDNCIESRFDILDFRL